jgi:hypothetical protein
MVQTAPEEQLSSGTFGTPEGQSCDAAMTCQIYAPWCCAVRPKSTRTYVMPLFAQLLTPCSVPNSTEIDASDSLSAGINLPALRRNNTTRYCCCEGIGIL